MVTIREPNDEPYFVPVESDNQLNRTYWKVLACAASGCNDASFRKAYLRSFICRDRLKHYTALHLNRSSHHLMPIQEAYDRAAAWVDMEENIMEVTETFEARQEYREQEKKIAYRKAQKAAASRPRTPSRGREPNVQNREPGHERIPTQERSRSARRGGNHVVLPPPPPSHPPPPNIVINPPAPNSNNVIGSSSKAGVLSRQLPTKQTASSSGGSAGSAGDTVAKSHLQFLHDVLTRGHGALNTASKACEALRRTFHDESEVINEAKAALKNIMER
jgi:hypothetical protein